MAEQKNENVPPEHEVDEDEVPGYKPPEQKSIDTIRQLDQEDESLQKYKEALLGSATNIVVFPNDPRHVIMKKLVLVVEGRDELELDISGDDHNLKKQPKILKEGCQYNIRFEFFVQREIVTGLKYMQKTHRKGLQVDKTTFMMGSYAPKDELQTFITPLDDAPCGLMHRGTYTIKSEFIDDDKSDHLKGLKWEWTLEIKKDWE